MKLLLIKILAIIIMAGACYYAYTFFISSQDNKIRIAICTPITHLALEEIEQGFKDIVKKSVHNILFTTFNANSNKTLLRAQAEEVVHGEYDLVCTIGAQASHTMAELLNKRQKKMPHIFCAVDSLSCAHEIAEKNSSSTGVYVNIDYEQEMDQLFKIKPHIQRILLVYDPTHGTGLEKYKKQIERHIIQRGVTLDAIEIYHAHEIQQKVAASLSSVDVVLVLIDNTVVSGIDALITLCNKYGVTLMASDLASGKKGAALAYGITEYESGAAAGHKALEIIEQGKNPSEMGIAAINQFRLEINKETMHMQQLIVDDEMLGVKMLEILLIIFEQIVLYLPLIIGAYISFSLLKIPDLSIECAFVTGAIAASYALHCNSYISPSILLGIVILSSLAGGASVALVSSLLTQKGHLPHLLSSIITLGLFHGINHYISPSYVSLSRLPNPLMVGYSFKVHPELMIIAMIACAVIVIIYLLCKTQLGYAYAIYGDNPYFFNNYAISTTYIFMTGVVIANALAGLSGYLVAQSNNLVELNMGTLKALFCITALVMGKACALSNKPISLAIPLMGVTVYFILQQLLLKVGINMKYFTALQALLVACIVITMYRRKSFQHIRDIGI